MTDSGGGGRLALRSMRDFACPDDQDVAGDIREKYGFDGDLLKIFVENKGRGVHKWHHYLPLYDRYFQPYRGTTVRFLEIGVSLGGSLQMWRAYLGPRARIFGIDVNPACAALDGEAAQVRIGSQDDPEFLARVIDEMGGVDVVLDDGSHRMDHIRTSFETLFPRLADGGTYVVEDLHTAYWPGFGGGFGQRANFFNYLRGLTDDMHVWYHNRDLRHPGLGDAISGIHMHDSFVAIDKGPVHPPRHSVIA